MHRPYPLLALALILTLPAQAADNELRERAARKACLTGDAAKGADLLADLYIDTKNPVHIYNQGRCFEQSNRYEEAIARFREYLRTATAASEIERTDAEKHIADCEALLAKGGARGTTMPTASTTSTTIPGDAFAPTAVVPGLAAEQAPVAVTSRPGFGLRTAGVVTAAAGGAALIAAVILNVKSNGMVDDLKRHYDEGDASSRDSLETLSQVGYGVGATLVAGGAVLYYLGRRAANGNRLAVLPAFGPDRAGALLQGAF